MQRWRHRLIILVCTLLFLPLGSAVHADRPAPLQQPDGRTISGSPLTIRVGSNTSIQVYFEGYSFGQVFGDADSGFYLWAADDVFGPNQPAQHLRSAANPTSDYVVLDHLGPTGAGTRGNPWVITTRLRAGDAVQVTQRISYINGDSFFQLDWELLNLTGASLEVEAFHAADIYFADVDFGFGYYDPVSGAIGGYNRNRDWYMTFHPITPYDHYMEAYFNTIWDAIGSTEGGTPQQGPGFDDTIVEAWVDNGIGLQWHRELAPGGQTLIQDYWTFGGVPIDPVATVTPTPLHSPTPTATETLTPSPTATVSPTTTLSPTATVPPTETLSPTPSATATITLTPSPSLTPSITATPTATGTVTTTPTPTATATSAPTRTPTPVPLPETLCYVSGDEDFIYRVESWQFSGYDTIAAKDSQLRYIMSPPAPRGWNQPGLVLDDNWRQAVPVWWGLWDDSQWGFTELDAPPIGIWQEDGDTAQGSPGITHLLRREFMLEPPGPGMRISEAEITLRSDNKTAWWWQGARLVEGREGVVGTIALYPDRVAPEGGTYLLAVQNSNDYQASPNPHGTAYRLCVTWEWPEYRVFLPIAPNR